MPIYNHKTGDFDAPVYIKPKKYMIIEGLLPFHTQRMRLNFDVKVYLDPPEELRYTWKIQRDTAKRGYTEAQVRESLEKRKDLSPRYIHPQKRLADMIVRFYPPETNVNETGGHLNAQLVLKPTVPHPDLTDVLQQGGNGINPALRLNLARYEGTPADFMEIAGNLVEEKAHNLISLIQRHMPEDCHLNEAMLGQYQSGLKTERSLPLALTQHLIAYHMVSAGLTIDEMQD
jgi:phosphoribulokinase